MTNRLTYGGENNRNLYLYLYFERVAKDLIKKLK